MIDQLDQTSGVGGVQPFKIARSSEIQLMPYRVEEEILQPVSLKPGATWIDVTPQYQSIEYKEAQQRNFNGEYFEVFLSCFVARADFDRMKSVIELDNDYFVIDATDNVGLRRLIGTKSTPLLFRADLTVPAEVQKTSGYRIFFSGKLNYRAPFYNI